MVIQLINSLGANRHIECRIKPNKEEPRVIKKKKSALDTSCGKCYRFDKYLVVQIHNFKRFSANVLKSHNTAQ